MQSLTAQKLSQHFNKPNFLSLFKKFLSVSKQGSFFNVHFQILPALARNFHSFRAHQCSSDQMQILKDHSAHTTRAVDIAYRFWLPFSINSVQLNKVKEHYTHVLHYTHPLHYITLIRYTHVIIYKKLRLNKRGD